MQDKKPKSVFKEGAITSEFIGNSIYKHQTKTSIGAHNIFLGQVRADDIDEKTVMAIEYTAYEDMANAKFHEIREVTFEQLEGRRYYLRRLMEQIISTAVLKDYDLDK